MSLSQEAVGQGARSALPPQIPGGNLRSQPSHAHAHSQSERFFVLRRWWRQTRSNGTAQGSHGNLESTSSISCTNYTLHGGRPELGIRTPSAALSFGQPCHGERLRSTVRSPYSDLTSQHFRASSFAVPSAAAPSDLVIYTNSFGAVIIFASYYRSRLPAHGDGVNPRLGTVFLHFCFSPRHSALSFISVHLPFHLSVIPAQVSGGDD
jgi:hypothetical protein